MQDRNQGDRCALRNAVRHPDTEDEKMMNLKKVLGEVESSGIG